MVRFTPRLFYPLTHIRPRGSWCGPEMIWAQRRGGKSMLLPGFFPQPAILLSERFVPASKECVSLAASTPPHSCVKRIMRYSKWDSSIDSSPPVLFLFSDTRRIACRFMKYGGFAACSLRDLPSLFLRLLNMPRPFHIFCRYIKVVTFTTSQNLRSIWSIRLLALGDRRSRCHISGRKWPTECDNCPVSVSGCGKGACYSYEPTSVWLQFCH
jgi:hypothetical protein